MTSIEKNELMAEDLKEMLLKYNIFYGTSIYFNNKRVSYREGNLEVEENIKVEDYLEWGNPDTISISYEGVDSLYLLVNGYAYEENDKEKAAKVMNELRDIEKKYNRWFDLGNENILYFVEDDEVSSSNEENDSDEWGNLVEDSEKYHLSNKDID